MTVAAGLAQRRRRKRGILVACAIVAVAAIGVVAVLALGGDSESSASTGSGVGQQVGSSSDAGPVDATPSTIAAETPATEIGATISPLTTAPPVVATFSVATVATLATAIPSVVPATVVPATVAPATVPGTIAPASTASPTTSLPPPPASSPTEGDLGLSTPITRPSCDNRYITLIGASVDPSRYAAQIGSLLNQYPGSKYLKTELVCSSLRARNDAGNAIYVLYFGPFATKSEACAARTKGPDDAYVKVLDNTSDPTATVDC